MIKAISFLTGLFICPFLFAQTAHTYHVSNTFHVQSSGGWDYIAVNNNNVYVSHGTQVNILDKNSGDSVGVIPNTTGVHGIAFDNTLNRGYTSNGRLNTVTVFDLKTNAELAHIPTGTNPDAILYDKFSNKVVTCNGRSSDLSVIDPTNNTVVATIPVGGKPETAVSDNAGKLYVNIEDKSEIAEVDLKNFKVLNRWSIAPGESPTGLAFDKATKRLFAGCDNKLLIVLDATDGKVVSKLPIGDGCDGVAFDSGTRTIFASNGDGTLTVINEKSANDFVVAENVPIKRGARTLTVDESSHTVYLPAADYEPAAPGATGRPRMLPGTFQILVVK
jgi:YVTN family beta-propeller protein